MMRRSALLDLFIVAVLIGLIIPIILPKITQSKRRKEEVIEVADKLHKAIRFYKLDRGHYPMMEYDNYKKFAESLTDTQGIPYIRLPEEIELDKFLYRPLDDTNYFVLMKTDKFEIKIDKRGIR